MADNNASVALPEGSVWAAGPVIIFLDLDARLGNVGGFCFRVGGVDRRFTVDEFTRLVKSRASAPLGEMDAYAQCGSWNDAVRGLLSAYVGDGEGDTARRLAAELADELSEVCRKRFARAEVDA